MEIIGKTACQIEGKLSIFAGFSSGIYLKDQDDKLWMIHDENYGIIPF